MFYFEINTIMKYSGKKKLKSVFLDKTLITAFKKKLWNDSRELTKILHYIINEYISSICEHRDVFKVMYNVYTLIEIQLHIKIISKAAKEKHKNRNSFKVDENSNQDICSIFKTFTRSLTTYELVIVKINYTTRPWKCKINKNKNVFGRPAALSQPPPPPHTVL